MLIMTAVDADVPRGLTVLPLPVAQHQGHQLRLRQSPPLIPRKTRHETAESMTSKSSLTRFVSSYLSGRNKVSQELPDPKDLRDLKALKASKVNSRKKTKRPSPPPLPNI